MTTPASPAAKSTPSCDLTPGMGSTVVIGISLVSLVLLVAASALEFFTPAATQLATLLVALN